MRLSPLSAYRVLGVPLDELAGQDVDLSDIHGRAGDTLLETLREAPPGLERFRLVRDYVAARAAQGPGPSPEVAQAWRRLAGTRGQIPVAALAAEVGWSHQYLVRRFRQQTGRAPKAMARLIRFRAMLHRLEGDRLVRWDRLAAEHGYYDQSHLYRDFHEFAATTPTGFLARRLPCGCMAD
ncbi:helix-turn-helix domain-containing protein [Streptomyces sp. NPDC059928]|uniref:AraC family transcriptional regulator n=1 Tax=unclassified Streptomyces TaxID=2593676 RepID=UPI003662EC80